MIRARLRRARYLRGGSRNRRRAGLALTEGPTAVLEAVKSAVPIRWIVMGEDYRQTHRGGLILEECARRSLDVDFAARDEVLSLCSTEAPQPVVSCTEIPPLEIRDCTKGRYLFIHGVQVPGNAGTLIRSAWGFGLDGVILGDDTVDVWNEKVIRSSAGAVFHMPMCAVPHALGSLNVICADPSGAPAAEALGARLPNWVLVVGHETRGINPTLLDRARRISIPLADGVDSLNVAVAGAILMYELLRAPLRFGCAASLGSGRNQP